MADVWDPARLAEVGHMLDQYATHLAVGDRIRVGQEGDPCSLYHRAEDAPTGTVTEIQRDPNGYVRFRATMHETGAAIEFDNRNVSPGRIWEIDPSYAETFRGRLIGASPDDAPDGEGEGGDDGGDDGRPDGEAEGEAVYGGGGEHGHATRSDAHAGDAMQVFEAELSEMRGELQGLKDELATLRSEARDLFRGLRGTQTVVAQSLEGMASDIARRDDGFSKTLLDRYEMAQQADAALSEDAPPRDDDIYDVFRGPRASILRSEPSDDGGE